MKILQIINNLSNGGAENFVVDLSNEQVQQNEVSLVCYSDIEPHWFPPRKLDKKVKLITYGRKSILSPKVWTNLLKTILSEKPDIIHLHLPPSLIPFYLLSFLNRKIVYTIHNSPLFDSKINNIYLTFLIRKLNKYFFKNKIKPVIISSQASQEFIQLYNVNYSLINYGIKSKNNSKNTNLVLSELIEIKSNLYKKIFLNIGRVSYQKNYELLVEIAKRIEKENIPIAIVCIISNRAKEQQYYDKLFSGKPNNLYLLDAKSNVHDYLTATDALIMTSHNEGMPLVMMEAFEQGKPVLATPVGALVDFVKNGENGFIAKDISLDSMMEIIYKFMELNETEIESISNNNKKIFETQFNIKICAEKYMELYNK